MFVKKVEECRDYNEKGSMPGGNGIRLSPKYRKCIFRKLDRNKLLFDFNDTEFLFPKNETIFSMFEKQVEKYPENTALVCKGQKLTYKEYNEKSNQLARILRKRGVSGDSIVAIIAEPSFDMAIGIMGILKAGGAYLPIDPAYPEDRIKYMLHDSGACTVITQSGLDNVLIKKQDCIYLDKLDYDKEEKSNPERIIDSRNLAYIIYTSGTTGKPKGVMVEHRSVINTLYYRKIEYGITHDDTAMEFFSFAFDGFVTIFFTPLISGAKVVLLSKDEINDVEKIKHIIVQNKVTNIISVPALYGMLLESLNKDEMRSLRLVTLAGDSIPEKLVKDSYEKSESTEISVEYGVTEAAVMSTIYRHQEKDRKIKIGKPTGNTKLLILNRDLKMVPIGTPGELCIGGVGLARGYINKPELTEKKFIENPYFPGERLYRTGDLAQWLPDGNIVFLGRIDNQVKIRGFRIEVSEIENRMLEFEGISKAVVVVRHNKEGSKYLCAYYVAEMEIDKEQLKDFMSKQLPVFMIPQFIIEIGKMPLTPNGKVDRNALPEPWGTNTRCDYQEPKTHLEKIVTEVWEQVLGIKKIGLVDNFFHLGGDSIKAMQITARLLNAGYKLKVKDLVNNPSPAGIIPYIKIIKNRNQNMEETGEGPLTPIQRWFFENNFAEEHHWNQSLLINEKEKFDENKLEIALWHLIKHHDVLRTVFIKDGSCVSQYIKSSSEVALKLEVFDYIGEMQYEEKIKGKIHDIQKSFDLSKGLLIKFVLFRTCEGDQLFITAHHLIIDSVSFRVILEDLTRIYTCLKEGKEVSLPDKTSSYKEWAVKLNETTDTFITSEEEYWKSILEHDSKLFGVEPEIDEDTFKDSTTVTITLSKGETHNLVSIANRAYNTKTNDLLIAALVISLKELTGKNDVLINLEGHGREDIFDELDVTRTIGWFTSAFPALFSLPESFDLGKYITVVKESLRSIPNNGIGYGILKYLSDKSSIRNIKAKSEINFNFLGQMDNNQENGLFEIEEVDLLSCVSEKANRTSKLDMYGLISNDKLFIHINYNENQFSKSTIHNFCKTYKSLILNIVNHCTAIDHTDFTKSDFNLGAFPDEEFDIIKRNIKKQIKLNNVKDMYLLSPMQEGMLYSSLYNKDSDNYFQQMIINLKGHIEHDKIERAFNLLIRKHDVLRTLFLWEEISQPMQVVLAERPIKLKFEDISDVDGTQKSEQMKLIIQNDKLDKFDLKKDPLFRVHLIKIDIEEYVLLISFHHIIMDGWCFGLIFDDFLNIISGMRLNKQLENDSPSPYSKYIKWLSKFDKEAAKCYWESYLSGYVIPANFSGSHKKGNRSGSIREKLIRIEDSLGDNIINFAKEKETTLNTVFQSAWGLLLQKYLMRNDVIFGYVVSGRPPEIDDVEKITGLFINTVPLRIAVDEGTTYIDVLRKVKEDNINSKPYENLSLAEIQSLSAVRRELFDHIMIFENFPAKQYVNDKGTAEKTGFEITNIEVFERTEYNFTITITPNGQSFEILFQYVDGIFDQKFIDIIGTHLISLIQCLITHYDKRICEINFSDSDEIERIFKTLNNTSTCYDRNTSVKKMFEQAAERYPESIAVRCGDEFITYKELNERSNRWARLLISKGVCKESIVGLMFYPSIDMIMGILAVVKSGGAYLPIEPDLPESRIEYMLADSGSNLILCSSKSSHKCPAKIEGLFVDKDCTEDFSPKDTDIKITPDSLAYVIYTSGSTGMPKGVQVEQRNLLAYIKSFYDYFTVGSKDVFLQQASYSFDAFVEEMYPVLLKGGTIAVLPRHMAKDLYSLHEYAKECKVTMISASPLLLNELDKMGKIGGIHTYISGGDVLKIEYIQNLLTRGRVVNTYGPTETTVCCTYYECKKGDEIIPIGKPIANYEIFIMDENKALQPFLMPGEICIGGEGVTRGYLNNEILTKGKYVQHPYKKESMIYCSGDFGRLLADGNIEFLGRIDAQVKIRGYRIETQEVEGELLKYEGIKDAVVISRKGKDNEDYLCAYFTSEKDICVNQLRDYMGATLPAYMIPAYFIRLAELPVNTAGKVNKAGLPEPYILINTGEEFAEPTTYNERIMVKVVKNILGFDKVSINDRFLNIGGDSLKAIRIVSSLKEYNISLKLNLLMNNLTIKDLAKNFVQVKDELDNCHVQGEVKLHPYHLGLFNDTFKNGFEYSALWNTSGMFLCTDRLDFSIVKVVANELVRYHDALRTAFYKENGIIKQYVKNADNYEAEVLYYDLTGIGDDLNERILDEMAEIQASFTLDKLFKVVLFRTDNGDYLYFTGNHLVTDAYSDNVIYEDFFRGYDQVLNKQKVKFPIKTESYGKWIEKLYEYSSSYQLLDEIDYWNEVVKSSATTISKDFNDIDHEQTLEDVADMNFELLDMETTRLLKKYSFNNGINIFDILLSAWSITVYNMTGAERTRVFCVNNGRNGFGDSLDVSRTVGSFMITHPVLIDLKDAKFKLKHLNYITWLLENVPGNGFGFEILKYLTGKELKRGEELNLPAGEKETFFNYVGEFEEDSVLADIGSCKNVKSVHLVGDVNINRSKKAKWASDFNVFITMIQGKLSLRIQYSILEYKKETVEKVIEEFRRNITDLITKEGEL